MDVERAFGCVRVIQSCFLFLLLLLLTITKEIQLVSRLKANNNLYFGKHTLAIRILICFFCPDITLNKY